MAATSKWVIANWKMNGDKLLVDQLAQRLSAESIRRAFVFCPPAVLLDYAARTLPEGTLLGGQDCAAQCAGAYTGDVSAGMISDCGARFVLVGHSERRHGQGETPECVAQKLARALEVGLTPVLCVGETRAERESGQTEAVIQSQLLPVSDADISRCLLAYEPVWAIGTGLVPSMDEIAKTHTFIHSLCGRYPLYGGSVNVSNHRAILDLEEVSGVLVGGESLKPDRLAQMLSE